MKKKILISIIAILLLSGTAIILLFIIKDQDKTDNAQKELEPLLKKEEVIIDVAIDDSTAFAITSMAGHSDYGDTLVVFHQSDKNGWDRVYDNDFKDLKPWKIAIADVDGDKEKEIITAVCKTVHFDKTEKNRLFVFNYMDGKLVKKWTGSQIAGNWVDFNVGDFAPMDGSEVVFIRRTDEGERVSVYYWYYFGFLQLAESNDYKDITGISIIGENRILMTYKKDRKKQTLTLMAQDGKLVAATK